MQILQSLNFVSRFVRLTVVGLIIFGLIAPTFNPNSVKALSPGPEIVSPYDSEVNVSVQPILYWNQVNNATGYTLQVALDAGFTQIGWWELLPADTLYYMFPYQLVSGNTYYWRVLANTSQGDTDWSAASFTTELIAPPYPPELNAPFDLVQGTPRNDISLTPTLWWFSGMTPDATTTYQLQVATDVNFTALVLDMPNIPTNGLNNISYNITTPLTGSTMYYWRVREVNVVGPGPWSAVWNFITVLSTPVITAPLNTAVGVLNTPTFTWAPTMGATTYQLQIATDAAFTTIISNNPGLAATTFTPALPLLDLTTYYWRVSAQDVSGTSAWSPVQSFTTANPIIATAPVILGPLNAAKNNLLTPTFSWQPIIGATSYHLKVFSDKKLTKLALDVPIINTTTYMPNLPFNINTTYYWQVNANNATSIGPWSLVSSFRTTGKTQMAKPRLVAPKNNLKGSIGPVALSWQPVVGATNYTIQFAADRKFVNILSTVSGLTTPNYTYSAPLTPLTKYYWRVYASDPLLGVSPWSLPYVFTSL